MNSFCGSLMMNILQKMDFHANWRYTLITKISTGPCMEGRNFLLEEADGMMPQFPVRIVPSAQTNATIRLLIKR